MLSDMESGFDLFDRFWSFQWLLSIVHPIGMHKYIVIGNNATFSNLLKGNQ